MLYRLQKLTMLLYEQYKAKELTLREYQMQVKIIDRQIDALELEPFNQCSLVDTPLFEK